MKSEPAKKESRESQMISLASSGMTDKQIARELGLSQNTLESYWRKILVKHGASSRTEVVAKASARTAEDMLSKLIEDQRSALQAMEERISLEDKVRERSNVTGLVGQDPIRLLTRTLDCIYRKRVLMQDLGLVLWWIRPAPPWTVEWVSDSVTQWGYEPSRLACHASALDLVEDGYRAAVEAVNREAVEGPSRVLVRSYPLKTHCGSFRQVYERLIFIGPEVQDGPRITCALMDDGIASIDNANDDR